MTTPRAITIFCYYMLWIGALAGCQTSSKKTIYDAAGWRASDFFEDPKVIALIGAIEANDPTAVKREIELGANVNAVGVDGMTPLLWALVSKDPEVFRALVEAGADPGVVVSSDFNTKGIIAVGTTVAHLAAFHKRADFFMTLLENGLDPNLRGSLPQQVDGQPTLFDAIFAGDYLLGGRGERVRERIEGLLSLGPNQEVLDEAAGRAIGANKFEVAEALFRAGANPHTYTSSRGNRLHQIVDRVPHPIDRERKEYDHLVEWLVAQGEDLESARKDVERWHQQSRATFNYEAAAAARKAEIEKMQAADKKANTKQESSK